MKHRMLIMVEMSSLASSPSGIVVVDVATEAEKKNIEELKGHASWCALLVSRTPENLIREAPNKSALV